MDSNKEFNEIPVPFQAIISYREIQNLRSKKNPQPKVNEPCNYLNIFFMLIKVINSS